MNEVSVYDYEVNKPGGKSISLKDFENEVMLIVNTANHCQFTYQYEDLQKLHKKYAEKGFNVLSFPCNQFGEQNPEDAETTAKQCMLQFGVEYPVFEKIEVNGEGTHPLFRYLKTSVECPPFVRETFQQKLMYNKIQEMYPDYLLGNNIRWNFTKFLVDRNGRVIRRFEPDDSFLDIERLIEQLL